MSLVTRVTALAQAVGADIKALLTKIGNLAGLTGFPDNSNVATMLQYLKDNSGGTSALPTTLRPFRGALVKLSSAATLAAPPVMVPFATAEYDTDSFFNVSNPTRLTIPAGVTRVRLFANIGFAAGTFSSKSDVYTTFQKNGGNNFIGQGVTAAASGFTDSGFSAVSAVLTVQPGDYFEVRWNTSRAGTATLAQASTCFGIEVVPDVVGMPQIDASLSRTLALSDIGSYIRLSNSVALNVNVPPQASVAWPVGTEFTFEQGGSGKLTFVPGSGVTINRMSPYTLTTAGQYAVVTLKRTGTNVWTLFGALGV